MADRVRAQPSMATPIDPTARLPGLVLAGALGPARELKIPLDVEAAVAVAAERRRVLDLDVIEADGRRFITQVGVGLDAHMIGSITREAQRRQGRFAYFTTLLRMARRHQAARF